MTTTVEYRTLVARSMSEADLQAAVIDLAKTCRWMVYHTHDSRRSEPGYPDLCCVRQGRLLYAELKSERGKCTEAQNRWLDALDAVSVSVDVRVWRPSHLLSGEIAAVLK